MSDEVVLKVSGLGSAHRIGNLGRARLLPSLEVRLGSSLALPDMAIT
jgi:hypothetical protein